MAIETLRLAADPLDPEAGREAIEQAAAILRRGGTVAFATETVYGLGANALDPAAVERIFVAKARPAWDPLIVHVGDVAMLPTVAESVPEAGRLWMERFFPGPLTLLLPRRQALPGAVTASRPRVGVRMPRHPVAQALLRAAGVPIAAPSANLFGHVSPTTAAHVLADLDGRIDAVLDSGHTEHGLESTIVDSCEDPCLLYRPGAITLAQLAEVWPRVKAFTGDASRAEAVGRALPSPGVGLRHYAPRAQLILVEYGPEQDRALVEAAESAALSGLLLPAGLCTQAQEARFPPNLEIFPWGDWHRPETLARWLFAGLRALDEAGVDRIVCPLPSPTGIGAALCDRLAKAAKVR